MDFPLNLEGLLGSVVELLKHRGAAREIGIILASEASCYQGSYDNWNGGTRGWTLSLELEVRVFAGLSVDELGEASSTIKATTEHFFEPLGEQDFLERVLISPSLTTAPGWRDDASRWLSGVDVNNQGRVRSDNIAARQHKGLLFRSQPEINLFNALMRLGVTFAPLPVFVRGGDSYARLEPDFVIIKDAAMLVVEVDGDTYHRETPVEAQARLRPLEDEGATVIRVPASQCATPEAAKECAAGVLRSLEKRTSRR